MSVLNMHVAKQGLIPNQKFVKSSLLGSVWGTIASFNLVVPVCYEAYTKNNKVGMMLDIELVEKLMEILTLEIRHKP